ncbi:family 16 glycosylhydrolase [Paludisphaera mucosa]|uniref:Family 16 glycosylhydrolase n=1 Tax=Paludisphaera mucosa TaxID=3030827 RepID=A0ABT6FDD5_9BACT|nr:family 16 glycosylhydrolase [Paludisphaera mucosa]MDG3005564.1 family 16 glycosylhydrolase [Paludisphaera mucosa]
MFRATLFLLALSASAAWCRGDEPSSEPPGTRKVWTRVGPLGDTPRRVTDAFPLSDQKNEGGWTRLEPLSDEFEGDRLDPGKWNLGLSWWRGRQPALFSEKNVVVADGKLRLTMRKETLTEGDRAQGYHDYTSAAIHSKVGTAYGYYEVKARPMNSAGSSSFWFQHGDGPDWGTEIDVFELAGKSPDFERKVHMTLHIFRTPTETRHWSVPGIWEAPWRLADDDHVYGLEWSENELAFYLDGVPVHRVENTHWRQPLQLIFDSETMPDWFGMPADADLPSTFNVDYVRAWKKGEPAPKPQP